MKNLPYLEVIIKLWKINKVYVILLLIGKLKDVPFPMLSALYTKYLIDSLVSNKSLLKVFYLLSLFLVFEFLLHLFDSWFNIKYESKKKEIISKTLISEFFEQNINIQLKHFESTEFCNKNALAVNELIPTYFNIFSCFVDALVNLLTMLSLITVIFIVDKVIIISSILVLTLYFIINNKSNKIKIAHTKQIIPIERFKRYLANLLTTYENIKNIRVHYAEKFFINKWMENIDKSISVINRFSNKLMVYSNLSYSIFSLFQYSITMYTAYIVWIGKISIGSFSGITQSIFSFMNQLRRLSETLVLLNNHSNLYRIIKELNLYVDDNSNIKKQKVLDKTKMHSIEFKNLDFSYGKNSDQKILNDISFKINPGEKIAIIGDNASGKSTLVNLLLRLYEPPDNTIFIDGVDVKKFSLQSIRENFSVIQQNSNNYALTVAENITFSTDLNLDESKINDSLKLSCLYEKICLQDKGIFSTLTKSFLNDGLSLSGGESQKLNISRFFNKNSPILILDEYERWLDRTSSEIILKNIIDFSKNKTLIIISHNEKFLSLMDKVVILKNGSIES
ncbi:MAG: ABC transporter ATP-binding protein/permease [Endomicrobium sp.]|jgi:ATP-binding cassette subfamily B protein|nr:ABC transporter ATP-binding protein/permease [Endomicrobium sp.]